jgi:hypothetical protein
VEIEQRNRFKLGDRLEVLSPSDSFNKTFAVNSMFDAGFFPVETANIVQQKLYIKPGFKLQKGDMLRKKTEN